MNQAKIIRPEVQRNGSFQVSQLAREGQRQPMKTCHFHSERQILSFDIGCTNLAVIGDAKNFSDLRSRYARRRIASWARIRRGVKLGDLRIGRPIAKVPTNGWTIRPPSVGTHLCRTVNTSAQIGNESVGIDRIPLAHMEGGNHFADWIKGNIGIGIPKLRIGLAFVGLHDDFLLLNERPNLILRPQIASRASSQSSMC